MGMALARYSVTATHAARREIETWRFKANTNLQWQIFTNVPWGSADWCEVGAAAADRDLMAAVWLARLHAAALLLPQASLENEDGLPELPAAPLQQAERNLAPFAGWFYRTVFDPDPRRDEEPVMGDVGDDLLDTYKDVKAGCLLYAQGRMPLALWHWSLMHRIHWGKHAVDALAALHAAMRAD